MISTSGVNTIDISLSDSVIASGHRDGSIRLWGIRDSKMIKEVKDIHDDSITSMRYLPDGN